MFSPVNDSESESHSVVSDFFQPHRLYSSWNFPGQNTGVCSLSLLQGIFPTQGSNLGLPHCRQILYQLSHKGSPRIMEWVAYPFSKGSSRPRNGTGVSCIAGGFFTNSAIREALNNSEENVNGNWQYYQEKTFNYRPQNWTLIRTYGNTWGSEEECKNYFGVSGMGIWIRRKNTAVDTAVIDYVVWKY